MSSARNELASLQRAADSPDGRTIPWGLAVIASALCDIADAIRDAREAEREATPPSAARVDDEPVPAPVAWQIIDIDSGEHVGFARSEDVKDGVRPFSHYLPLWSTSPPAPVQGEAAALAAILTIHCQALGDGFCRGCWEEGGMDGAPDWPCRTAQIAMGGGARP